MKLSRVTMVAGVDSKGSRLAYIKVNGVWFVQPEVDNKISTLTADLTPVKDATLIARLDSLFYIN